MLGVSLVERMSELLDNQVIENPENKNSGFTLIKYGVKIIRL